MKKKEYWYWLCNIEGIGLRTVEKLLLRYQTPEKIFLEKEARIKENDILKPKAYHNFVESKKNIKKYLDEYHRLKLRGIKFITIEDPEYPNRLKNIETKPLCLYVKGEVPDETKPSAAIIGARNCTNYGREMSRWFGAELAKAGIQIVSGMALGIDGAGQEGAILGGGKTFGILGSGVDVCYPKSHWNLYHDIMNQGGVLSEQPPGSPPLASHFPMRNRIISGLSDCIIVMEAKKKSGSLITVELALEQGKDIFALPGRVTDAQSEGCNGLIKEGAQILSSPGDILEFFQLNIGNPNEKLENICISLAQAEKVLYSCLNLEAKHLEQIAQEAGVDLHDAINTLMSLEQKGFIRQTAGNYYSIKYI